jgi:uncharacterized protein YjiS (DUF1127 family)
MSVIADTRLRAVSGLAENVIAFLRTLADAFAKARACSATYQELSTLGDRDLEDMGIRRADIASIARRSAYGA